MKMLNIATTIIDLGVKPEAILSRSMPPEIQSLIKSTDEMRSSGFQEVLGYKGRKLILSAGGSWDGKKFIVDSVGGILNGEHIYWKKGGKVERVNKKSNNAEKVINIPLSIAEMNVIWLALSGYKAGSGSAWVRDKEKAGFDYKGLLSKFFKYI